MPKFGWIALAGVMLLSAPLGAHDLDDVACATDETSVELSQSAEDLFAEFDRTVGFPVSHNDRPGFEMIDPPQCRGRFCFGHSAGQKVPLWSMEKLTRTIACGDQKRPSSWSSVKGLKTPAGGAAPVATDKDYTHTLYSRGHLAPSNDFTVSLDWMKRTFTFGNAVPQWQNGFNGSYWRYLEDDIKQLALHGHTLYVVTGPIPVAVDGAAYEIPARGGHACRHAVPLLGRDALKQTALCGGTKADGPKADCAGEGVSVPAGMFKIIYMPDANDRMFAYAASNQDHKPLAKGFRHHDDYIETWRVSVADIEAVTDLEFFPNLGARQAKRDKNSCIETRRH